MMYYTTHFESIISLLTNLCLFVRIRNLINGRDMPQEPLRPNSCPAPAEEAPVQWGQFAEVVARTADAVLCFDGAMSVRFANAAAAKVFGYTPEEFEGLPLARLIPSTLRAKHATQAQAFLHAGDSARMMAERRPVKGLRKDGSVVPLRISLVRHAAPGPFHVTAIARDISDFISREADLKRAVKRAHAADIAKSQFLANVTHELKTPLNAIIGFADLLADRTAVTPSPSQVLEYATYIGESGLHLLDMLEEVIAAARLEADRVRPTTDTIALDTLVAKALSAVGEIVRAAEMTVKSGEIPHLSLQGDERLLRIALRHVLSNAVRFGRKGRAVTVHAEVAPEAVTLVVEDDGPGMDSDALRRAGEPFFQSDAGMTRRSGGLGLGLFIARRILQLHGGTLEITSMVGEGTSVALSIPRTLSSS